MSWDMWTPKTRLFRNSLPFRKDYSRGALRAANAYRIMPLCTQCCAVSHVYSILGQGMEIIEFR